MFLDREIMKINTQGVDNKSEMLITILFETLFVFSRNGPELLIEISNKKYSELSSKEKFTETLD